ncbi:MAG: winged helix-turn-helix domain-containing protein [candidate division WOR-3 bacterium]
MSSGLASLHKILKDETRRKIILLLNEKGSLSYTDLINTLGIDSTGTLNYHLKVLGELISKSESGLYALTEKGKLASRLLLEFPNKKVYYQTGPQLPRWLIIITIVVAAIFMIGFITIYLRGIIDFSRFVLYEFIAVSTIIIFLISLYGRRIRAQWSPKRQIAVNKIISIVFYALAGTVVFLLGGSMLLYSFQTLLQLIGIPVVLFPFIWWVTISFILGPIIGGFVGYLLYKRSSHSKTAYHEQFG